MYCPACGKEQANSDVRFCVKCGLALDGVKTITSGGVARVPTTRKLSRRARGVLEGIAIVPVAFGLWLLLDIFYEVVLGAGMLGGLYAMFTMITLAAIARIVYALVFEGPISDPATLSPERQKELSAVEPNQGALPFAAPTDVLGVDVVLPTAREVAEPHSVTEHTTKKLHEVE